MFSSHALTSEFLVMMITPWLINWEAKPHFSATYCSLENSLEEIPYYVVLLCSQGPEGLFSPLPYSFFSSQAPSKDLTCFLQQIISFSFHWFEPSTSFSICTHEAFTTLCITWSLPCSQGSAAFVTVLFSVLEIMLTFSSMLCAALTPGFPSQRERKATTQHTNFSCIQTHGEAGIYTLSCQHRANCHFFASKLPWTVHLWSHCIGECRWHCLCGSQSHEHAQAAHCSISGDIPSSGWAPQHFHCQFHQKNRNKKAPSPWQHWDTVALPQRAASGHPYLIPRQSHKTKCVIRVESKASSAWPLHEELIQDIRPSCCSYFN